MRYAGLGRILAVTLHADNMHLMAAFAASAVAAFKNVITIVDESHTLTQDRSWRHYSRVWELQANFRFMNIDVSWLLLSATLR